MNKFKLPGAILLLLLILSGLLITFSQPSASSSSGSPSSSSPSSVSSSSLVISSSSSSNSSTSSIPPSSSIANVTLSFVSNQGTAVNAITAQPGNVITAPTNPTRSGYTFAGWFSDEALTTSYTFSTMPSQATILYAKWTINQYTITFNSNEGSLVTAITQDFDTAVFAPTNPTRTGYTFAGWFSDEALTTAYSFTTMPSQSITLYAKWTISQYSINFNSTGGSAVDRITQDFGTSVSAPTNPTWTGYTFTGWLNISLTPYTFTTMPSQNITLYAGWTINQYTITFDSNEGTSVTAITQDFDTAVSAPTNPTRTGYTFAGWFSDEALTSAYTFSTMPSQATTLYAKWTGNPYSISYSYKTIQTQQFEYVVAGGFFSLGMTPTNQVYAWGYNANGQLGDDTTANKSTPTRITFTGLQVGETIEQISAGSSHSLAVTSTGRVYAWGLNVMGRIGDGTTEIKLIPTLITFTGLEVGETIKQVNASSVHSIALTTNGRVYAWGGNMSGRLGDGTSDNKLIPTLVSFTGLQEGEKIRHVSSIGNHNLAVTTNGRLFAWGRNDFGGSLGDGTTVDKYTPTLITFTGLEVGETIEQISTGNSHSLVLTTNGRVYAWGLNNEGQVGDGTTVNKLIPTLISFTGLEAGETIEQVSGGSGYSHALTTNGRVYSWGSNYNGQLGDGTDLTRISPTLIAFTGLQAGETIEKVSGGNGLHSLVVTTNGRIYAWGRNAEGQLVAPLILIITTPKFIDMSVTTIALINNYLTVNYNDAITLVDPNLEGYDFAGWFMDDALTIPYNLTTMPANDVTLYASFNPEA
jgi:uncharacterized repeat protein (TIGR02543 family)